MGRKLGCFGDGCFTLLPSGAESARPRSLLVEDLPSHAASLTYLEESYSQLRTIIGGGEENYEYYDYTISVLTTPRICAGEVGI